LRGSADKAHFHRMSAPGQRHLLIDGSNVVQAWPDTRALARRDREAARRLLLRRAAALHDTEGWRVTVVFDGRGPELSIEAVGEAEDFACITTPAGATADDVIERLVGRAAQPGECLVATADQAERSTVEAAGAASCDPHELLRRIEAAEARATRRTGLINRDAHEAWTLPPRATPPARRV
jgi:uncharacterized protein